MDVYRYILNTSAASEGHARIFSIENSAHSELTDISSSVSKCFAILHVKFGYDKAVIQFNHAVSRIAEMFDIDICELSSELDSDTLLVVTVLVVSGYETVLLRELVKFVITGNPFGGYQLKPEFRF